MNGVSVRSATPDDAPAIARVHWDSWLATYRDVFPSQSFDDFPLAERERLWQREAGLNADPSRRCRLLVAVRADAVAGFAHVGPYRVQPHDLPDSGEDGELRAIYLAPALQRCGIGSALWAAARQTLREAGFGALRLWCIAGNPAEAFYVAVGAQPIGSASFDAHGRTLRETCFRLEPL